MRDQDYATYISIRNSRGLSESYLPWVRRMRPEDRLYVYSDSRQTPPLPGLEWFQPVFGLWSGRLPRTPDGPASTPAASRAAPPAQAGAAVVPELGR